MKARYGCIVILIVANAVSVARAQVNAFKLIAEMDRIAARPLWPNFEPLKIPVAIFDGERTLLFRHPSPPEGFEAVQDAPGVFAFPGRYSAVTANTNVQIGGVGTATVMLDHSTDRSLEETAAVIVHEAFHVFQASRHSDWQANDAEVFVYPFENVDGLVLRRLETEALRRALGAEAAAASAGWAKTALHLREQRFKELGSFADYEVNTELKEGLAQYVQFLACGRDAEIAAEGYAPDKVRPRAYATGSAFAFLLDRFEPSWKAKLEAGPTQSLSDLLADALPEDKAIRRFTERERQEAKERAVKDVAELKKVKAEAADAFEAEPGWRVTIEAGDGPLWPNGFDPMNVRRIDAKRVLHSRFLKLGNASAKIEILGRPSLTVAAGEHPIFNGIRRLLMTGFSAEPKIVDIDGKTRLEAEGLTATFDHAAVERSDRAIVITLSK